MPKKQWSPSHRLSTCEGKHSFPSFTAAKKSMLPALRKVAMPYHCQHCNGWHIGNHQHTRATRMAKDKIKARIQQVNEENDE